MRAPAYPLITVDPYFSLWSMGDCLNGDVVRHWTGEPNTVNGFVVIDGEKKRFLGDKEKIPAIQQIGVELDAMSTEYRFADEKIELTIRFTAPLFCDNVQLLSRPVNYMSMSYRSLDRQSHTVSAMVFASEELVMNKRGDDTVEIASGQLGGLSYISMGKSHPTPAEHPGDQVRIDWGKLYLATECGESFSKVCPECGMNYIFMNRPLTEGETAVYLLAYDDEGVSLNYFGLPVKAAWCADGTTILEALTVANEEYPALSELCTSFSDKLYLDAARAGGTHYAEMLSLAYRQAVAAHKCCIDDRGELIFISKENSSNGCAATMDISYPSAPMFLLYNPELVKGMLRPVLRFARTDLWRFPFCPHDAGQYPVLGRQAYDLDNAESQMPLEESGNALILEAAIALAEQDVSFAEQDWDLLEKWAEFLAENGEDPINQNCTDDFAGHLAHNCNLTVKSVMGMEAFSILCQMRGKENDAILWEKKAQMMADSYCRRASNGDGSFRLAYPCAGTFSMKYNMVWDRLFGTKLFPAEVIRSEIASNFDRFNPYGMPLDSRSDYTKSDWLVWTATLCSTDAEFRRYIEPLWLSYHHTPSRVPMTDWYYTSTSVQKVFKNRAVVGGFFIKLLDAKETVKKK